MNDSGFCRLRSMIRKRFPTRVASAIALQATVGGRW
ncbi:Uncharacterised protein [Mycobacterium tuberculosis]|nr:Uncharacterised protein [Mycobacterium tuberculosis]